MADRPINLSAIARWDAFVRFGLDLDDDILRILADRAIDGTARRNLPVDLDLDQIPVGAGYKYQKRCAAVLKYAFDAFTDADLVRLNQRCCGGSIDIQMPIRTELLGHYPLMIEWCRRYNAKSILVEVKNRKSKANDEDVRQLFGYLDREQFGSFGLLISRSGFTKNAMEQIRSRVQKDECLILPLDHCAANNLPHLRSRGTREVMRFLRRQETLLRQAS